MTPTNTLKLLASQSFSKRPTGVTISLSNSVKKKPGLEKMPTFGVLEPGRH